MDSLDENEFCETNVTEGAKRTNDSLSFLYGILNMIICVGSYLKKFYFPIQNIGAKVFMFKMLS
jgi:hypothetical protein